MISPSPDHEPIIELLPDYAIGGLDEAELDRVARHLEECAACRAELLRVLELGAIISDFAPPPPAVRLTLLNRVDPASGPRLVPEPEPGAPAPTPITRFSQPDGTMPARRRAGLAVLAAVAAMLILGLGLWNLRLREENQQYVSIAGLVSASTVYPLLESQLSPPASGVLLVGADDTRGLLVADGLPVLEPGEEYQVWLFDERGQSSAAARFTADDAGRARVELLPPLAMSSYVAVAISAEPAGGSAARTGPLALGGWLGSP